MGKNKKREITVIREEDNEEENHLEPNEKPHNETYCRDWVRKSKNAQDDSESIAKQSDVSSIEIDIMNISGLSNLANSAEKTEPEVKANSSSGYISNKSETVKSSGSITMYVVYL